MEYLVNFFVKIEFVGQKMDDILSIILCSLRIPQINKSVSAQFFKNLDIVRAYKWAKIFVEYNDFRVFNLVWCFPEMAPNIAQYAIMYKNDDILCELYIRKLVNHTDCELMLNEILLGNFPKTCALIALMNINLVRVNYHEIHNYVGGQISKINTKIFVNYFHVLNDTNRECVFKNILTHGFVKTAKKLVDIYHFNLTAYQHNIHNGYAIYTRLSHRRVTAWFLDIIPNDIIFHEDVLQRCDIKLLKFAFNKINITADFFSEIQYPGSEKMIYQNIFTNINKLFILESFVRKYKPLDFMELARMALTLDYYPALNSLIMMKKIKTIDKYQLLMEILVTTDPNIRFAELLLKDPNINLKNENFVSHLINIRNWPLFKLLFADPRINTPENHDILMKNSNFVKKESEQIYFTID
jgi:hypothetical protein